MEVLVKINKDPGYADTATMIAESALCLVYERDRLAKNLDTGSFPLMKGGVLTASTAMGSAIVDRLSKAGFNFTVNA